MSLFFCRYPEAPGIGKSSTTIQTELVIKKPGVNFFSAKPLRKNHTRNITDSLKRQKFHTFLRPKRKNLIGNSKPEKGR